MFGQIITKILKYIKKQKNKNTVASLNNMNLIAKTFSGVYLKAILMKPRYFYLLILRWSFPL